MKSRVILTAAVVALLSFNTASAQDQVTVEMETSEGTIVIELNRKAAPKTVENFLKYVENKHFEETVFHRVIRGFMIQGGGLDAKLVEKDTLAPIRNESANGLKNEKYTIAMARTSAPHSATSQFFINTENNLPLNRATSRDGWGYAVFGKVVSGQEVVDKIEAVKTQARPNPEAPSILMRDVPVEAIVIKKVTVKE